MPLKWGKTLSTNLSSPSTLRSALTLSNFRRQKCQVHRLSFVSFTCIAKCKPSECSLVVCIFRQRCFLRLVTRVIASLCIATRGPNQSSTHAVGLAALKVHPTPAEKKLRAHTAFLPELTQQPLRTRRPTASSLVSFTGIA